MLSFIYKDILVIVFKNFVKIINKEVVEWVKY